MVDPHNWCTSGKARGQYAQLVIDIITSPMVGCMSSMGTVGHDELCNAYLCPGICSNLATCVTCITK